MARIKKDETVMVMIGKDRGKTGQVIELDFKHDRVKVRGIAMATHHAKARKQGEVSSIKREESFIHLSNVMPVAASTGKPTRVGYKILENGAKERIARKTGEAL